MKKLLNSYGKTFHFWQVDRGDVLPFGEPKLMASFTEDGQLSPDKLALRNEKFGIDGEGVRLHREGWVAEPLDPDCLL
jgi:hypothetical protein